MLSKASFLPFLICFWSAMPVEPWLQKALCWKRQFQDAGPARTVDGTNTAAISLMNTLVTNSSAYTVRICSFPSLYLVNLIRYKHAFSYCCSHEGRACSEVILWDEFAQCISSRRKLKTLLAHWQYCLQNTEWILNSNYHWTRVYVRLRKLLGMTGVWNVIFAEVCRTIYSNNSHKFRRNAGGYTSC